LNEAAETYFGQLVGGQFYLLHNLLAQAILGIPAHQSSLPVSRYYAERMHNFEHMNIFMMLRTRTPESYDAPTAIEGRFLRDMIVPMPLYILGINPVKAQPAPVMVPQLAAKKPPAKQTEEDLDGDGEDVLDEDKDAEQDADYNLSSRSSDVCLTKSDDMIRDWSSTMDKKTKANEIKKLTAKEKRKNDALEDTKNKNRLAKNLAVGYSLLMGNIPDCPKRPNLAKNYQRSPDHVAMHLYHYHIILRHGPFIAQELEQFWAKHINKTPDMLHAEVFLHLIRQSLHPNFRG
jgi:hypothetical protein